MLKLRIRFCKTGNARFISHLDLLRVMCRAMRRANVPIKYTAGFNPRPHMVFGNPISLGYESLDEICDIELNLESANLEEIKDRLNETLPVGIEISDIYERETKSSDISYTDYTITIETESFTADDVKELLSRESLVVMKRSKSGEKETDILTLIKNYDVCEDDSKIIITALLPSSSSVTLNPDNISKAIRKYISEDFEVRYLKNRTFDFNGKEFR